MNKVFLSFLIILFFGFIQNSKADVIQSINLKTLDNIIDNSTDEYGAKFYALDPSFLFNICRSESESDQKACSLYLGGFLHALTGSPIDICFKTDISIKDYKKLVLESLF